MEEAVKPRKKKGLLILLAILIGVVIGVAAPLYHAFYDRKVPNFSGTYEFFVRPGMEPSDVVDTLLKSGVVLNRKSLRRTLEPLGSMSAAKSSASHSAIYSPVAIRTPRLTAFACEIQG